MIIDRRPRWTQPFFQPFRAELSTPQFRHLWTLVLALAVGGTASKLLPLAARIHPGRHRTRLGAFLRSRRLDLASLLQRVVLVLLRQMQPQAGEMVELIIDDHRTPKRGQQMACLSKIWDHAHQRFTRGHVWVTAALAFRGVILPWRLELWKAQKITGQAHYRKSTQMAAACVREFIPLAGLKVRVLFDAFYLCPAVTKACESRGFTWFSVAARNRTFTRAGGHKGKLGQLAPGWVRHQGRCVRLPRARGTRRLKIAAVHGQLHSIGPVHLVASKRPHDRWDNLVIFATNERGLRPREIVSIYEQRWNIEVMFKELRSDLGLDDYQVRDETAIVHHVHLCTLAHLLLTHHALEGVGAQARKPHTEVALPPLSLRRAHVRAAVSSEQITHLLGGPDHAALRCKLRPYLAAA